MKKAKTVRRKRRGHIFRRGAGYSVRWMIDGKVFVRALRDDKGKAITEKGKAETAAARMLAEFSLKDEAESVRALVARMEGVKEEIARVEEEKNPGTSLLAGWTAYKTASNRPQAGAATMRQYSYQYETMRAWMEANHPEVARLNQVTRDIAREYVAWLESEGRTPNTVNKHLNLFSLIWRILEEPGRIDVNPWSKDSITRRRLQNGTGRRELSIPELKKITEKAEGELRTLIAVGMYTGLRLGDACRLDWSEVDIPRKCIVTAPRKTRETSGALVAIPISPPLMRVLAEVPEAERIGPIMPTMAERYEADQRAMIAEIQQHFRDCGITTTEAIPGRKRGRTIAGFHSLRHSFITHAAMAGWPETLVRSIVGHTSGAVTKRYIHTSVDAVKHLPALPDPLALPKKTKETTPREPMPAWVAKEIRSMNAENWKANRAALLALVDPEA